MLFLKILTLSVVGLSAVQAKKSVAETLSPPRDPAYQLAWADEFEVDGPPDPSKWKSERGFERNEELQWYQPDNSRCKDGLLVIEARREDVPNPNHDPKSREWRKKRAKAHYTSGSLITTPGNAWHFGRAEVRARFNALPGLWPAIWTTGIGKWPHSGEMDILEFYNGNILANFAWAGKDGKSAWLTTTRPIEEFDRATWDDTFHLWVTEWDRETMTIHLDGKLLATLKIKDAENQDGPPIKPFLSPQNFRLNLAIGAAGGDPSKTAFPQRYEIDYVRIYQNP